MPSSSGPASSAPPSPSSWPGAGGDVVCVDKGPAPGAGLDERLVVDHPVQLLDDRRRADGVGVGGLLAGLGRPPRRRRPGGHGPVRAAPATSSTARPDYDGAAVLAAVGRRRDPLRAARSGGPAAPVPGPRPRLATSRRSRSTTRRSPTTPRRADAFYNGDSGYIDDPMLAAHNLAHAAGHHGARFRFGAAVRRRSRRDGGRVTGVELDGGDAHRRAGRRQRRRPALGAAQRDGRRHRRHAHRPPGPAPGGVRRAGPARVAAGGRRAVRRRPRPRPVLPAPGRRHAARRRHRGRRATSWSGSTTPTTSTSCRRSRGGSGRCCAWPGGCRRSACPPGRSGWPRCTTWPTTGCRSTTARSLDGFFMACGTSGNQFKNAPLAGQFVRALVDAAAAGDRPRRRAGAVPRPGDRPHDRPRPRSPAAATRRRRPAP